MSESSNDIIIACKCGQRYRVPPEYAGQTVNCDECGNAIRVPAVASSATAPSAPSAPPPVAESVPVEAPGPAIDMHIAGDREVADPDTLMNEVRQSRMTRAILISLVAHVLLVGLTSFGLYSDWANYGIKMPYEIKAEKKAREEAEQKRKAKEEADKKEAADKAEKAAQPEGAQKKDAAANTGTEPPRQKTDDGTSKEKSNYEKKVMEVSNERPTKSSITGLDGDLDLGK